MLLAWRPRLLSVKGRFHLAYLLTSYSLDPWQLPWRFEPVVSAHVKRWMVIFYSWSWLVCIRLHCNRTRGEYSSLVYDKEDFSLLFISFTILIKNFRCTFIRIHSIYIFNMRNIQCLSLGFLWCYSGITSSSLSYTLVNFFCCNFLLPTGSSIVINDFSSNSWWADGSWQSVWWCKLSHFSYGKHLSSFCLSFCISCKL